MIGKTQFLAVLGLLVLCGAAWGSEPIEGLISHWKFDEGSGTIAYDSVGGNVGTIYGATWTTGQIDDALSFDGSGDYIDCGNNASISNVSVFSVSLWFKTNGIPDPWPAPWSYPHMISHRDLSQVFWAFYLHGDWSGKLVGSILTTGSPAHSVLNFVPDVGTWYHAVMTYDDHGDRKVRVYVDGEELSYALHTSATGTMLSNPSVNIAIGNRIGGGRDWDGVIDDVRIYDRALSAEEVEQLYQEGFGGFGLAIFYISDAIAEKEELLAIIDETLEREEDAYAALEQLLESGDYGDLDKRDIAAAQRQIESAIRRQQRSRKALLESIESLEDSLSLLGSY